jgi:3-deoxy-7-phosphoheptulonate synthase
MRDPSAGGVRGALATDATAVPGRQALTFGADLDRGGSFPPVRATAGGATMTVHEPTAAGHRTAGGDASTLDDRHVASFEALATPQELRQELPISAASAAAVTTGRDAIAAALRDEDPRMVVVVGPCSIHDPAIASEYAGLLRGLQTELAGELIVVMRTYFEKPRTSVGWKGLIYDPGLDGSSDASRGLRISRQVLLDVTALGLPCAVEVLDTITPQYQSDLVSWAAIGARTVESQVHRQLASGLSMPIGFKNGTDGSIDGATNALGAAVAPHSFFGVDGNGRSAVVRTTGNPDVHVVLRGGSQGPNYASEHVLAAAAAATEVTGHVRPVMVDCSHGNSGKDHRRQSAVVSDVLDQWRRPGHGLLGLMLESNLAPGRQDWVPDQPLQHGVSITDACIGWDETVGLLHRCAEVVAAGR